jgi:hypothetical protein
MGTRVSEVRKWTRNIVYLLGFPLALVSNLCAQQPGDDHQRTTLVGLRRFGVYAKVQVSEPTRLQPFDEALLRAKMELAMRREGMVIMGPDDVRDGSGAQISLLYLVIPIRDKTGHDAGFAAFSCLHASQTVRIPRLSVAGRITYTVAPTWSSCAIMAGDNDSFSSQILQNADEQIARFLKAWRAVNKPTSAPPVLSTPELGVLGNKRPHGGMGGERPEAHLTRHATARRRDQASSMRCRSRGTDVGHANLSSVIARVRSTRSNPAGNASIHEARGTGPREPGARGKDCRTQRPKSRCVQKPA